MHASIIIYVHLGVCARLQNHSLRQRYSDVSIFLIRIQKKPKESLYIDIKRGKVSFVRS